MAKDREIVCVNYLNEGNCTIGREGTFRKYCQTCNKYIALAGGRPARKDLRKAKKENIIKKEMRNW